MTILLWGQSRDGTNSHCSNDLANNSHCRCIILEQHEINLVESLNKDVLKCSVSTIFTFQGM